MSQIDLNGALTIRTASGAVYHFDPAESNGERNIRKEKGSLAFSRGKLAGSGGTCFMGGSVEHTKPVIGEQLAIEPTNGTAPKGQLWFSTSIVSIEQA